jgi:GTP diphosphokinase / guanosine-3',5'-bis(diphosphate) 3'-diphosphatase
MSREDLIQKAKNFAIQVHEGHKRISGENYYEHTFRVYEKLRKIGIEEENTLIAAILHQTPDVSREIEPLIEKKFGKDVLNIVRSYKKLSDTNIERDTPNNFNEKYIMQAYINMAGDLRTLVIRLADKIDNLETSFALPKEKRVSSAQKALYLYSPLARIIGLSRFAIQLENSAFKILNPGEFSYIKRLIDRKVPYITKALNETQSILKEIFDEQKIEAKFQQRIKHVYGIYRKATYYKSKDKEVGKNFENIYDIAAMRIIVNNADDCYLVENILKNLLDNIPEERNDYIRTPRHTGYKSIHNVFKLTRTIKAEIQIRTNEMHDKAEYGPASHLLYKIADKDTRSSAAEKFREYLQENPYWFKELQFISMEQALNSYKPTTPFSKFVYAFTPKGDIIEIPKGATLIDFAYAVHSSLGHSCIGGFANGQLVKISYEIKDGDQIEIKTLKSKTKPSPDWLNIAKTSKAKGAIRKALKLD